MVNLSQHVHVQNSAPRLPIHGEHSMTDSWHGQPTPSASNAPANNGETYSPRDVRLVFAGLMLSLLLARLDQTIVSTALRQPTLLSPILRLLTSSRSPLRIEGMGAERYGLVVANAD